MYNKTMKTTMQKLAVPLTVLVGINMIGFLFHKNYEGAVVGSIIGMLVAFLGIEIKTKNN